MSRSVAPILATGAVTFVNETIFAGQPVDWTVPVATGAAAVVFAFAETFMGDLAVGLAYLALASVLLSTPSIGNPVMNAAKFFGAGKATK